MKNSPTLFSSDAKKWNTFGENPYPLSRSTKSTHSLETTNDKPIHQFWKNKLTDVLVQSVQADDGLLVHLSTEEYEHLFDWNTVCRKVKVIHPLFYVRQPDGSLKMQAVWAKSCRGAMVRFILNHQLVSAAELTAFSYEGFEYAPLLGDEAHPHFVRECR